MRYDMRLRNAVYKLFSTLYGFLYIRQRPIYPSKGVILLSLNRKKRDEGNVWDFLLGLALGSIGAHIFSIFSKPSCPMYFPKANSPS